jgi:hypothetical protein
VVGLFLLDGWDIADGGVQAPVVPPVDPGHGRVFDVGDGLQSLGVEWPGEDALGLVQPMIDSMRPLS